MSVTVFRDERRNQLNEFREELVYKGGIFHFHAYYGFFLFFFLLINYLIINLFLKRRMKKEIYGSENLNFYYLNLSPKVLKKEGWWF